MAVRVVDTDVWSYLYKGREEAKLYEPHLFPGKDRFDDLHAGDTSDV
jgi:hypothetical protein